MKLTKKQRKALQFKGKLDKPAKEDRPAKPQDDAEDGKAVEPQEPQAEPAAPKDGSGREDKGMSRRRKAKLERDMEAAKKVTRYITFIGNLPFRATAEELREFLKAANPTSVRLMTNKETGKSRGFAFVEFATSDDLRRGLKFHHCKFGGKSINVELTVGGGGNSEKRKQKLKRRREDLDEERKKESAAKLQQDETGKAYAAHRASVSNKKAKKEAEPEPQVELEPEPAPEDEGWGAKKPNRRKRGRGARK
ncbi:hypothetical protein H4R18_005698 [Coemansia javaensis]|uniref:RRM domain-containing protein n=1 Tax=Coemansia javaensis TaxID=2761396 RepID=A0A9W8LF65_9FUNG|nr:hypothetical protein H4R18_005698 [Coemansia javaensis]